MDRWRERLLEAGADVNVVNSKGQSGLHVASSYCREGAVELLLRHNATPTSCCDEGLSPLDVVGMGTLARRELIGGAWLPCVCTLISEENGAADRIHRKLRVAKAWGRWGWLVMMRARRLATVRLLDDSSMSEKPLRDEQMTTLGDDDDATEPVDGCVCLAVEGLSVADTCATGMPGELGGHEHNTVSTKKVLPGRGHGSGQLAGHGAGWEVAVEWLLWCPDERGVFREILGFL